jgi:cytochrome c553
MKKIDYWPCRWPVSSARRCRRRSAAPKGRRHRVQGLPVGEDGRRSSRKRWPRRATSSAARNLRDLRRLPPASGAGRPDGTFPQLAGQHTTVLIKQMADIRMGLRDNPTMYPFAKDADRSAGTGRHLGLHREPVHPVDHGKYEGADAAKQIAAGKDLYEKQCKECHGKNGEGNKDKFYPVIAGQHYKYLLRQMTEIRDGHRRNANPDMVKVIKPYTNDQLVAISAYQSSLVDAGLMCKPKAGGKKK